ncbi:MAG: LexA family transcriptional regulator [Burkholderiales bacterium]|nr:LexA family transcriptional regulator [Burkholderiales bacterium]
MSRPSADELYLRKLQEHYARHRMFPSYAGIGRIVGLSSTSSVAALLQRLHEQGYIEFNQRRVVPARRFFERALVPSRVAAGLPSAAFDAPAEGLAIDAHLIRHPARSFLIEVKGDSMSGAGLLPGDTVVVESAQVADPGDIVVALADGAYTVKRLARENRRLVLRPEHPDYPVLRPDPLEIVGVVVASFRKYR